MTLSTSRGLAEAHLALRPEPVGALSIAGLLLRQVFGRRVLQRRPEPRVVMNGADIVAQYAQVESTKLMISYALGWETIHRVRNEGARHLAVDFCSGPGILSCGLSEVLGYEQVVGLDLAPAMVEAARARAAQRGLAQRVRFAVADVGTRTALADGSAALCTLFDAAHHFDELPVLRAVLAEMARVTHPEGVIVVLDLARLRSAALTERYVDIVGADYKRLGLPRFFEEFRHSMYAAWTPEELREAVPRGTSRRWVQLVTRGLPALQLLVGLPEGRRRLYLRGRALQPAVEAWIPPSLHGDLGTIRLLLRLSRAKVVRR